MLSSGRGFKSMNRLGLLERPRSAPILGTYELTGGCCQTCVCATSSAKTAQVPAGVALADSFCQYVLRDGVFLTGNSADAHWLDGHKYQGRHGVLPRHAVAG